MKYVPMTDDEWAKLLGDDYPNGLYYGFYGQIEQAVLARIAEQGLVIVPKADAERVELDALIAELRELRTTPISNNDESIEFIWFAIAEHDLEEIINKYEDKP